MRTVTDMPDTIWTVGHSTRAIEEFVGLLKEFEIETLADVRSVPRSRRHPQFNQDELARELAEAGINYVHEQGLGGLRRLAENSPNTGWRNERFRAYADYMQTPEFEESLDRLIDLAGKKRIAIMCAEAVPWRCHRSLISDALLVRGFTVVEIIGAGESREHKMTPFARVDGRNLTYPG